MKRHDIGAADCSSRRTRVYSSTISKIHDPDLLIFVMIHGWLFAFRCVRYAFVMYITCIYRQNIYQATYVLYSCYMGVISYVATSASIIDSAFVYSCKRLIVGIADISPTGTGLGLPACVRIMCMS